MVMGLVNYIYPAGQLVVETAPRIPWGRIRSFVGCQAPELVRVLYDDEVAWMMVHDEGLALKLPRNQVATEIYLAMVRRAYPGETNPYKAARADHTARLRAAMGKDPKVIDLAPPGYAEDPYIAGPAAVCRGFSDQEVTR
jgi:hypothetical protein